MPAYDTNLRGLATRERSLLFELFQFCEGDNAVNNSKYCLRVINRVSDVLGPLYIATSTTVDPFFNAFVELFVCIPITLRAMIRMLATM